MCRFELHQAHLLFPTGCEPAVCCLQLTKVPVGEYLLQNAANSVLGKQLIALCKKRGIKTINLVRPRLQHYMLTWLCCIKQPYTMTCHPHRLQETSTHSKCQQVRNKAYLKELEAMGADAVIDTSSEDVPARVKEITGATPCTAMTPLVVPIGASIFHTCLAPVAQSRG